MSNGSGQSQSLPPIIPGSYLDRIEEARWHMDRREWDEAAAILQRVVDRISRLPEQRRRPGSDPAAYRIVAARELVTARGRLADWEGAEELCRQLEAWDANGASFWRGFVHVLQMEKGEIEEGKAGLYAMAAAEPNVFDHWMTLARMSLLHHETEHVEEALAHAERLADRVRPDQDEESALVQVHIWRFRLYREQQRWHEAARAWEMAVSVDPDYAFSVEMVVQMFMEAGLTEEAEEYLDEAVLGKALMAYYRGLIAQQRGDRVRARHLWRETIAATEDDEEEDDPALRGMAHCLLGEPRLALAELLEDYQVSRIFSLRTALVLALAWAMEGDLEAARTNLDLAQTAASGTLYHPGLLSAFDWRNFEAMVPDAAIKDALRPYFEAAPPAP